MPAAGLARLVRRPNGSVALKTLLPRPSQNWRKLKAALMTDGVLRGSTRRNMTEVLSLNGSVGSTVRTQLSGPGAGAPAGGPLGINAPLNVPADAKRSLVS